MNPFFITQSQLDTIKYNIQLFRSSTNNIKNVMDEVSDQMVIDKRVLRMKDNRVFR